MKTKKVVQAVAIGLALAGVVCTSCSKSAKTASNSGKRVINIASGQSPSPWILVDDNGNPGGYDIDVVRLVFERLPQYEPNFIVTEFASIFTGLDSGMYQFGVNHLGYNRARGEKYLFSAPYDYGSHAILVKKGSPIRSVRDFGGRSTYASPTSFNANQYEEYNKRHPENPITVLYTESDGEYALGVSSGRYDFYYFTRYAIEEKVKQSGLTDLEVIPVSREDNEEFTDGVGTSGQFYIYPKGEEQLRDDFDRVLLELIADGTIHKLREQYFGVTEDEDDLTLAFVESARKFIAEDQAQQ